MTENISEKLDLILTALEKGTELTIIEPFSSVALGLVATIGTALFTIIIFVSALPQTNLLKSADTSLELLENSDSICTNDFSTQLTSLLFTELNLFILHT